MNGRAVNGRAVNGRAVGGGAAGGAALRVLAPGPLSTVQDLGRPGYAALGVSPSGAADRPALALANRLLGNPEGAAAVEFTLGGLRLAVEVPPGARLWCVLAGAPAPAEVSGRAVAPHAPFALRGGDVLTLGLARRGLRGYLAVRGGLDVSEVLGSRSTDTLSGLGPEPLAAGRLLAVGEPAGPAPAVDLAPARGPAAGEVPLRLWLGPRDELFTAEARRLLFAARFEVTDDVDRVGARLAGPALRRTGRAELPPEGLVRGALQVPPVGQPVLFGPDHPTTGGYPVIGVLARDDLAAAAQLCPGQRVRFLPAERPSPAARRSRR